MRELRPGLWHWQAAHPEWTPDEPWPQIVSSYAIDDVEGLRPLLTRPVELVLPTHGLPTDRAALERSLA